MITPGRLSGRFFLIYPIIILLFAASATYKPSFYRFPVYYLPHLVEIVGASVLEIQIVGVLPYVESE